MHDLPRTFVYGLTHHRSALAIAASAQEVAMSEIKFNSGQSVQPAYEGWTRNPDGSRSMWFGYMNRNWEETPDVPAGPNNGFGAASKIWGSPRISFRAGRRSCSR